MAKYCSSCGKPVARDANLCLHCHETIKARKWEPADGTMDGSVDEVYMDMVSDPLSGITGKAPAIVWEARTNQSH